MQTIKISGNKKMRNSMILIEEYFLDNQYSVGYGALIIFIGLLTFNSLAFSQDTKTAAVDSYRAAAGRVANTVTSNSLNSLVSRNLVSVESSAATKEDSDIKKLNGSNSRNGKKTDNVENSIYRQVLPNGKILYTDHPMVQANIDKKIPMESNKLGVWSALPDMQKPSPLTFVSTVPAVSNNTNNLNYPIALSGSKTGFKTSDSQTVSEKNLSSETVNSAESSNKPSEQKIKNPSNSLMIAEARLNAANLALEDIDTPLENERSMNTNGTSRLNEKYFERQKTQRNEAQEAESELDAALSDASKTQPAGQR